MSRIRLTCGDGADVRVPKEYFEKSIFNNPDIAKAGSYTLKCKARSQFVNDLLDLVEGESKEVTITEDNVDELRSLCEELGFKGLDKEFQAFRREPEGDSAVVKEVLQLKEFVKRQDKFLIEIQRQLNEVLSWKRKTEFVTQESVSRQFQFLEKKIEELARVCEERNVEASQALRECAKRGDVEELARDVAQLNQQGALAREQQESLARDVARLKENKRQAPTKSPVTTGPARATPALRSRKEFVYSESKKLDGVIAHLTRQCGGNVHDKGIVNVTASSVFNNYNDYHQKHAVDLGTDSIYGSNNEKDTWICYDFKERRVIPKSYSVRSCGNAPGSGYHLKSWVIEVSNDGSSWTEIDRRDNNKDLNHEYALCNFKISHVPSESFRFFRLRQTGRNHNVEITSLEIFGTLLDK